MTKKPILAITMGDPAGIGPEITAKALRRASVYKSCAPLVIGDAAVLEAALVPAQCQGLQVHAVSGVEECLFKPGVLDVYDLHLVEMGALQRGKVSAMAGNAAFGYVQKAIELALCGKVQGTVTNPLNKEAMNLAGHHYAGHTEIYAALTGTQKYAMLLVGSGLRVVHVSTHVSLAQACLRVKKERVLEVIELANKACLALGVSAPRIGVAGLNPHCGEGGLFGREEIEEIAPAVEAAQKEGICAEGPVPPDTVFSKARGGWYDMVVAMYHDQGHIPLKVLGFVYDKKAQRWGDVAGVNITLGLPIIRTSVDHGTAFDQAWQGTASEKSLLSAIDYAARFAAARTKEL